MLFFAIATSTFIFGATSPQGARAQSLRCNGELAGIGDSTTSLVAKCGTPIATELVCVPRLAQWVWGYSTIPGVPPRQYLAPQGCEPMEEWTYHRGSGNFLGVVRLRNGAIESVRDGDRMR